MSQFQRQTDDFRPIASSNNESGCRNQKYLYLWNCERQRQNFEIPTANLEFSTTVSSMKVSPSDCDNDSEMARFAPKTATLPFLVVDRCRSRLGTLSSHAGIKNPRFAVGISLTIYYRTRDISIFVLAVTSLFPVVRQCRGHFLWACFWH